MNQALPYSALRLASTVLALVALPLTAGTLFAQAQPAPPDATVTVTVTGPAGNRSVSVRPPAIGVCRSPNADCAGEVTWKTNYLAEGESLEITRKDGSPNCFSGDPFILTPTATEKASGAPSDACSRTLWRYKVTLSKEGTTPVVIDPSVVIDP